MRTGDQASSESEDKPKEKTPAGWHKFWAGEVEAAQKRLRKFYKQGNDINRRFLDKREGGDQAFSAGNRAGMESRLNLFHTNVSTLLAMLYGSVPRIDVSREHHDPDDDTARVAAMLYQRILQADVEPSGEDLPTVLKAALQDRLLPGSGHRSAQGGARRRHRPGPRHDVVRREHRGAAGWQAGHHQVRPGPDERRRRCALPEPRLPDL